MFVAETVIVRLVVSAHTSPAELAAQLEEQLGGGTVRSAEVGLTDVMRAELRGSGFRVEPGGPVERAVSATEPTSWVWEVTALEPGVRPLRLELDALVRFDGTDRWRPLRQLEDTIRVAVRPRPRPAAFREALSSLVEVLQNLAYLWGVVVLPIGYWVFRRVRGSGPPQAGADKGVSAGQDEPDSS
jgi:hypothetical protein